MWVGYLLLIYYNKFSKTANIEGNGKVTRGNRHRALHHHVEGLILSHNQISLVRTFTIFRFNKWAWFFFLTRQNHYLLPLKPLTELYDSWY